MAGSPSRRTQEQRRAEAERRVVGAAIGLIARAGSRGMTLAQVGEAAGYSRGIVYHHFGSRERLLEAVVDEAQRFEVPAGEGDGLGHLVRLVEAYLRNIGRRTPEARAFLQLWGEAIAADPVLEPLFARRDADFRGSWRGWCAGGWRTGPYGPTWTRRRRPYCSWRCCGGAASS
ncbi:TetR/AcrR family transcriptional regulator [Streptomyces sp. Z26]|uniref:TetR/AcrR family transcriptional regulator n=1 Tax=Streptomyces sp. Z26 TaxID=2500177 RepID=UPI0019D19DCA|nr:TetR/AcrR family transcriptional regulator [Streptomyces sp. Z26]